MAENNKKLFQGIQIYSEDLFDNKIDMLALDDEGDDDELWMSRFDELVTNSPKRINRYKEKISQITLRAIEDRYPLFLLGISPEFQDSFFKTCDKVLKNPSEIVLKGARILTMPCETLKDFCAKYLHMQLVGADVFLENFNVHIHRFIPTYYAAKHLQIPESEHDLLFSFFHNTPINFENKSITYEELYDQEFEAACFDYLTQELIVDDELSEENFIRKLPEYGTAEATLLYRDILASLLPRLFFDIYQLFSRRADVIKASSAKSIQKIQDEKKSLKKQLSAATKELNKKDEEIKRKEETISTLTKKLKVKEKECGSIDAVVKEKTENIAYENKSLLRQNRKLQEYYTDLQSKYRRLKEAADSVGAEIEEETGEEMREVDLNARYLFLMFDSIGCRKAIKEEFPNAEFASKASSLVNQKYDMVIVLTECFDHSNYSAAKKQCKIHGIPFAHSPYSNLEMIKTVIWNVLNK